ncbi:MAG: DUF1957 domain-containing protein [Candidatus Omnitrophica bacterium]|nr:DUF1957 domain-containing protein [Candidatus Omnitrophota bacterium]
MFPKGFLAIVLHAHLPYVRHPEHEDFLEEDWLYEAINETYLPLIDVFNKLVQESIPFRITLSLSPTLISMLQDSLLQDRYVRHLDRLIELAEREKHRTQSQPEFHRLASFYHSRFLRNREMFVHQYGKDLVRAFLELHQSGCVELITCGATHGYLPLMESYPSVARAQLKIGLDRFEKAFGFRPGGVWLPECGFHPEQESLLSEAGIRYTFVDSHGILFGSPRPRYGVFAPCYTPSGLAVFGRDIETSRSVWSSKEGYPGASVYREFYRDIGFDLDYEYIRPYLNGDGTRVATGIKYYRITGNSETKEPYQREPALSRAAEHAGNFMFNREKQIEHLYRVMGRPPIVVSPYDAELFGHWWFEGPEWLDYLFRKIAYDQKTFQLITPGEYLQQFRKNQVLMPSNSSWGWKGYNEVWLNGSNDWIYRHLHKMSERMIGLATEFTRSSSNDLIRRTLNQMARELLLAQSSDWAFILKTGTFVEYARRRLREHIGRFQNLYEQVQVRRINESYLSHLESVDNIFSDINYQVYAA